MLQTSEYIIIFNIASALGIITNIVSLTYFLLYERGGPAHKLMILLNSNDLLLCSASIVLNSLVTVKYSPKGANFESDYGKFYKTSEVVFATLGLTSAWITFNMVLLRYIVITNPFYKIQPRVFYFFHVLFLVLFTIINVVIFIRIPEFQVWASVVLIWFMANCTCVIVISCITLIQLLRVDHVSNNQTKKRATVTIIIIGFINFLSTIPLAMGFTIAFDQIGTIYSVLIPVSSFINPLVYITRKAEMRKFVVKYFRRCC